MRLLHHWYVTISPALDVDLADWRYSNAVEPRPSLLSME